MKDKKIIISSLFIFISFFIWYYLSQTKKYIENMEKKKLCKYWNAKD